MHAASICHDQTLFDNIPLSLSMRAEARLFKVDKNGSLVFRQRKKIIIKEARLRVILSTDRQILHMAGNFQLSVDQKKTSGS